MQPITAVFSSSLSATEVTSILGDYLALDRARVYRRLIVLRCGGLACLALLIAMALPAAPSWARWFPPALFLVPPAWAWIAELRLERRLSQRLDSVDRKKVIKSP